MPWTCPECRWNFAAVTTNHECPGVEQYTINGQVPDGRDKRPDDFPALPAALPLPEAIKHAFRAVLSATGVRDGYESPIDPHAFHLAIRQYLPSDKHSTRGKSCSVMDLDYRMHAGRVAIRLINQSLPEPLRVSGRWGERKGTAVKLDGIYRAIRQIAAAEGLDPYTGTPVEP